MEVTLEKQTDIAVGGGKKLDADFQRRIAELRKSDNVTNWFYIAREYLWLAIALGIPLTFFHKYQSWGLNWAWNIPVAVLAIIVIGACQHRIANLGHEGGHYSLFKHRLLNELASNWFALFPMLGSTHTYRMQHLAHHQHLNHPELDPDMVYMNYLGQSFWYPMPFMKFLWNCVLRHVLWLPNLLRYIYDRAKFANLGGISGPYKISRRPAKTLTFVTLGYYLALFSLLTLAVVRKDWQLLLLGPVGLFAALTAIISSVPDDWFAKVGLKCDIPPRWNGLQRSLYLTMLITFLAAMTLQTGHPWPLYYFILWLVPLGTSFSMYMILREDIQHSNTGSGRLAHSRDFRGNALVRWSVFPMGQAYHLAHHLYPMVPHYNLPKVDALLRETEEYRREAVVVDSLLWPKGKSTSKRPLTEPSTAV